MSYAKKTTGLIVLSMILSVVVGTLTTAGESHPPAKSLAGERIARLFLIDLGHDPNCYEPQSIAWAPDEDFYVDPPERGLPSIAWIPRQDACPEAYELRMVMLPPRPEAFWPWQLEQYTPWQRRVIETVHERGNQLWGARGGIEIYDFKVQEFRDHLEVWSWEHVDRLASEDGTITFIHPGVFCVDKKSVQIVDCP